MLHLVQSEGWKGSTLIILSNPVARPTSQELAANYVWLRPLVADSPTKALHGLEMFGVAKMLVLMFCIIPNSMFESFRFWPAPLLLTGAKRLLHH